jgi:hypothetical protein
MALGLLSLGISAGDRIAISLGNSIAKCCGMITNLAA